jgi:serine protease AprX
MAGIIAGNDGGSFRGVAPGARLLNIKVATRDGATDVSQVIAAVDWVVQHRADAGMNIRVLNLAFGTDSFQDYRIDPLAKAVEEAERHGIVVVVAGGNDGSDRPALTNPAIDPFVLAVGAVNLKGTASVLDDVVAPFSSRGSASRSVDLVAPGVSLASLRDPGSAIDTDHPTAVVQDRFFRGSGTSQAAAVVSGAAALLLDARPNLTPDQVKRLLTTTAQPLLLTSARAQGAGRINVNAASLALTPLFANQTWTPAAGTGLLEASRGTSHVADDGVELRGEIDIMSSPWDGRRWAPMAAAGAAWSGGTWNGADWTGSCFCALSWAGSSWEGRSWTGRSWTGRSWTGGDWEGRSWTGRSWTGDDWTGRSWTGRSWTGRSWTTPG